MTVVMMRAGTLPNLVELGDLRGDLQVHTRAIDGRSSLAELVEAARALDREYVAAQGEPTERGGMG